MKTYSILFLLIFSFSAFGQSAKKINKQLWNQVSKARQKEDSLYLVFQPKKNAFDSIWKAIYYKSQLLAEQRNTARTLCLNNEGLESRLRELGVDPGLLTSSTLKLEDIPHYNEVFKPVEEAYNEKIRMRKSTEYLRLEGLDTKQQNMLLGELIDDYTFSSKANVIRLEQLELNTLKLRSFYPSLDSLSLVYDMQAKELASKKATLQYKLDEFRSNYAKKGPNGFPEVYRKVFPDVFPPKEEEMIREVDVRDIRGGEGSFFEVEKPPVEPAQADLKFFDHVDEPASFPGGNEAMKAFFAKNLRYPEKMKELNISGRVYLKFIVLETGELCEFKVVRGLPDCKECDEEAIRVVKMMPKWIPGKNNGKAVKSYFNLPVQFMLD